MEARKGGLAEKQGKNMTTLVARASALMAGHGLIIARVFDLERASPSTTLSAKRGFIIALIVPAIGLALAYGALWAADRGYRLAGLFEALSVIIFVGLFVALIAATAPG
jgi:hypothetical protein